MGCCQDELASNELVNNRLPSSVQYIPSVGEGVIGAGVGAAGDVSTRANGEKFDSWRNNESWR